MRRILRILLAIAALGVCIAVHETGHLVAARLAGISVESFNIGFLRTLFAIKIGETEYRLNLIPWGGYVSIPTGALKAVSFRAELLFLIGGPLGNFVGAWLLSVPFLIKRRKGLKETLLEFLTFPILPLLVMWYTVVGIVRGGRDLTGPVGMTTELSRASAKGGIEFLTLLANYNLGVGVFNLLPILPLDGGKILLLGLEAISPGLAQALGSIFNEIGFLILVFIAVMALWSDLKRLRK